MTDWQQQMTERREERRRIAATFKEAGFSVPIAHQLARLCRTLDEVANTSDADLLTLGRGTLAAVRARFPAPDQDSRRRLISPRETFTLAGLSPHTAGCLARAGYRSIDEVAALSDEELLKVRFIGQGSLREIRAALNRGDQA